MLQRSHLSKNLDKAVEEIKTKDDLVLFLQLLLEDFRENINEWENVTLADYLEALAAWLHDSDGFYQKRGEKLRPSWKMMGEIFLAAKYYE